MSEPKVLRIELPVGGHGMSFPPIAPTSAWRSYRPVINYDICINCGTCVKYCPIGCIEKTDDGPKIDYTFCKGCGICATECTSNAIDWVEEA